MKKFLALVMAVAMVLSMSAVSFADFAIEGPYDYDADNDCMRTDAKLAYGDTAYFLIKDAAGDEISEFKAVEKLKVKAEFEMGEDLVESVSIVKKAVAAGGESELGALEGYFYFVGVKIASKETTSDADIIGTFTFNRKAVDLDNDKDKEDNIEKKIDDVEIDFAINVFYGLGQDYINDSGLGSYNSFSKKVTGDVTLDYDTAYALKFDNDDEVELTFGDNGDANEGVFNVDISGQGKVYLKFNTKANEAIVAANPGVTMKFVNFNNVKFNRAGTYEYEMDDVVAAYKVVGDELVAIPGVEVDTDVVTFKTRVLESYVFADAELVNPVVAAPVVDAPVAEVTNPSTGA